MVSVQATLSIAAMASSPACAGRMPSRQTWVAVVPLVVQLMVNGSSKVVISSGELYWV